MEVELPTWSLILATDQPGLLLNALLNRIDLTVGLDYYPHRELKEVVEVLATEAKLLLKPQASGLVARAACGLPRKARQLLHNLRRHYPEAGNQQLSKKHVREFLHFMGIDETGLGPDEFRYLKALGDQGSASLETLASMLSTDTLHLRRQIEAVLVRRGLVKIAPGGRQLTATGRKLIEEHRKNNPGPSPEKDEDDDDD
ncbi:MAG: Holliday junction DNA helicase RuvB C-terminal domain-containing protein [Singulisphaera sp.]